MNTLYLRGDETVELHVQTKNSTKHSNETGQKNKKKQIKEMAVMAVQKRETTEQRMKTNKKNPRKEKQRIQFYHPVVVKGCA